MDVRGREPEEIWTKEIGEHDDEDDVARCAGSSKMDSERIRMLKHCRESQQSREML